MWGDYGYIEEDFERSYDFRTMRRFLRYARPYSWLIGLVCLLILAATATELVLPYLTKASLDRYIVVSARKVDIATARDSDIKSIAEQYKHLYIDSGQPGLFFLPNDRSKNIDPKDLRRLEQADIITAEPYYLADPNQRTSYEVIGRYPSLFQTFPKAAVISVNDLEKLGHSDLIRLREGDIRGLALIALACVIVLVIGYVLNVANVVLLEYVGQRITHDLRQDMLTHVIRQSVAFHDRSSKGKLVARLTNDIQNLNEMVTNVAVTFFKDIFILAGIIAMMLYLNLKLALIAFILLPVVGFVTDIFRRKARDLYRELRKKIGQINASFAETIAGIQIIQAFRREEVNSSRFTRLNHENFVAGYRQIRLFAIFMPMVELASAISLALIIWYGGLNVLRDTMTIGVVVAFVAYSQKLYQPIRELSEKFNILQSSLASLERIFILRDQQSTLPEPAIPQKAARGPGRIRFDRINFSYKPGEEILKDISFEVGSGQTVAIVGPTGAGKTSIINLLLRFYDPESGAIYIDGQNIRDVDPSSHRSRLGLVMQDVFIFAGSVSENIALSREGLSRARIEAAAKAVGAEGFIRSLPGGYDHQLGEAGRSLSVGQRQLLSFARVLAFDPQILVLDEATAFIDSESEKQIESAMQHLIKGRTSIIIAHRLSTIRRADKIIVLSHGRISEIGNHEELLAAHGLYFQLHQLQFKENGL